MAEEKTQFSLVMRGYDRSQVDEAISSLEQQLSQAREQVAHLDSTVLQISGELAQAQEELGEVGQPSYSGLGSRIERLLRSAEEQALDVITRARSDAETIVTAAQKKCR